MKIQTRDLAGSALDWAVSQIMNPGIKAYISKQHPAECWINVWPGGHEVYSPSTDWAQAGPIIEREQILFLGSNGDYTSWVPDVAEAITKGPTHLIAAMRCFVLAKLGTEVDIPDELTK